MHILSIEQSTSSCSIAIMQDYRVVVENEWVDTQFRNQHFFTLLPGLFEKACIVPSNIDILATGLGPGSFAGLRCALSALNGIALPDKKLVYGVASSEALASQVMKETGSDSVIVLGDARRGHIWFACYDRKDDLAIIRDSISLVAVDLLSRKLAMCETIATPDWDRIGAILKQNAPTRCKLIERKEVPRARTVGELALRKIGMNIASERLTPIYLHPPVTLVQKLP